MSRRRVSQKRPTSPDPLYGDRMVQRLINYLMLDGKKCRSESIVYGAFEIMNSRGVDDPVAEFKKAVENVGPQVEVKSRRVGGSTYQVPVEVRQHRRLALALRWIRTFSRQRAGRTMQEKLAGELMDAASGRGGSVRKREDVHRMAEANKAFSHYRW